MEPRNNEIVLDLYYQSIQDTNTQKAFAKFIVKLSAYKLVNYCYFAAYITNEIKIPMFQTKKYFDQYTKLVL